VRTEDLRAARSVVRLCTRRLRRSGRVRNLPHRAELRRGRTKRVRRRPLHLEELCAGGRVVRRRFRRLRRHRGVRRLHPSADVRGRRREQPVRLHTGDVRVGRCGVWQRGRRLRGQPVVRGLRSGDVSGQPVRVHADDLRRGGGGVWNPRQRVWWHGQLRLVSFDAVVHVVWVRVLFGEVPVRLPVLRAGDVLHGRRLQRSSGVLEAGQRLRLPHVAVTAGGVSLLETVHR